MMRAMARSAGALRNWAINLNKELAGTGVYAAHVGIDVSINQSVIPGFPVAPEQLSSPVDQDLLGVAGRRLGGFLR